MESTARMVVAAVLFLNRAVRVAVAETSRRCHRPFCRTASRILATAALYLLAMVYSIEQEGSWRTIYTSIPCSFCSASFSSS